MAANRLQIYYKDKIDSKLFKEELEICKKYKSKKRISEFSLGRLAARKALKDYNILDFPILQHQSGAPIWPEGIYGSISHSKNKAVAIVSKKYNLIGIDLEYRKRDINLNLKKRICTESEKEWVGENKEKLLSIFSTKEAIYKAFYNVQKLTFLDAELKRENEGFKVNLNLKPNLNFNTYLLESSDYITSIVSLSC